MIVSTPVVAGTIVATAKTYVSARTLITIGVAAVIPSVIALKIVLKGEL